MNQPSLFGDETGTPVPVQEEQAKEERKPSPDNLPLLSGKPDKVRLAGVSHLPTIKIDLRTGVKPK
jgi:hypothetical protein